MKTKLFILSALSLATVSFFACTSDTLESENGNTPTPEADGIPFSIKVGTEDTKTTNDGLATLWVKDEQINVFHAVNASDTYVSDGAFTASASGATVAFDGTISETLDSETKYDWYALYPYSDPAGQTPASFNYVTIGSVAGGAQSQVGNDNKAHLAGEYMPMWGKLTKQASDAELNFTMKHIASVASVNVTNGIADVIKVQQITMYTSADDKLVGKYTVDFSGSTLALTDVDASTNAVLNVTAGSSLAKGESASFYLPVAPVTFAAGTKITLVVVTDQGTQTLTSSALKSAFIMRPGKIHDFNFTFTNKTVSQAEFKYNDADWLDAQSITKPSTGAGTNISALTQTVAPISFISTDGSTNTRVWNQGGVYDLRVYNGATFTLSCTDDYIINKIVFDGKNLTTDKIGANSGTYTYSDAAPTWRGFAQDVVFSASATVNINTITVFYQEVTASDHLLSIPVTSFDVAYDATSTVVGIKTLNISDLVVSSTSPGYIDYTATGSTITINHEANADTSPRSIVVNVSSASAGVDKDITITQAGAPATISTLSDGALGTVTAQISSFSTKGFTISDATGSVFVYTNKDNSSTYSIGQTVTVSGTIGNYNKGLQFPQTSTITPGATGSYVYPTPTSYTKTEIDTYIADTDNRLATYVTLTGVIKKNGSNYDIIVGGGSTANVTMYYPLSTMTSGLAEGDNVTVTGYAINITSSKCGIIPTSVINNETSPKIIFSDITGVAAAGVTDAKLTVTPYRISGWTPTVSYTGCVTAASINAACTAITYSVGANSLTTNQTGTIVVTFEEDGGSGEVEYTINVTQEANISYDSIDFSAKSLSNGVAYNDPFTVGSSTVTFPSSGNNGKYYNTGTAIRSYGGNTFIVASTTKTITKIVLEFGTGDGTNSITSDVGTFSTNTWTGSSSSVTFTVASGSGHRRIKVIKIYY